MRSSWRNNGLNPRNIQEPDNLYYTGLTLLEYQMILHIRMLGKGDHILTIQKVESGREGISEFKVTNNHGEDL